MASHWDAKAAIQQKYFRTEPNINTVLLGFVGRITFQKGVHLILDIAEQLLRRHSGSVQILIGGAANQGELYAQHCAHRMRELRGRFPSNFWADADMFFVDGPLLNFGADFGLMPSAFEPGGIVQQEFMVANTPVIAFKTGGLRDTISEFHNGEGNGFTFEAHTAGDLAYAIERALKLFWGDKAGYQVLRDNARKSVVTCDMVARAWLRELYRMHAKTYVDLSVVDAIVKEIPDYSSSEMEEVETEIESLDWSSEEEVESDRFSTSGISVATPASTMLSRAMSRESSVPGIVRRSVRVTFKPKLNIELPRSVLLAGSFDQWASRIPLRWDKATRMFYVDIRVPQGKWQIKLIVDGSWTCIDDYPTEKDYDGNLNNVILVD
jgi:starch synthase